DGKLDLVVGTQAGVVSVLLGNGDGTFQNPQGFHAGGGPLSVTAGDFNRDGKLDLAVSDADFASGLRVWGLFGDGEGTFQSPVSYNMSGYSYGITAGDFNGDGILDLAVTNTGGPCPTLGPCQKGTTVSILLGIGDGTFRSHVDYTV